MKNFRKIIQKTEKPEEKKSREVVGDVLGAGLGLLGRVAMVGANKPPLPVEEKPEVRPPRYHTCQVGCLITPFLDPFDTPGLTPNLRLFIWIPCLY